MIKLVYEDNTYYINKDVLFEALGLKFAEPELIVMSEIVINSNAGAIIKQRVPLVSICDKALL